MVKSIFVTQEKEKTKETDKEFLSKNRAEQDTPQKDIDMVYFKKKSEIIDNICSPKNNDSDINNSLYLSILKNYILNEFSSIA